MRLFNLEDKLQKVNNNQRPAYTFYFYRDPTYCTIYKIIDLYKNFADRFKTKTHEQFNKIMSQA